MRSASAELARSTLDAAPDAIVITDASGSIRFANRQVAVLFGYDSDEIMGRSVEELLPERFRKRHVGHRERYNQAVRVRSMGAGLELYALRKDGTEFPVEISLSPIADGDRVLVAAAIRDATERKRVSAELISAREAADQARDLADRANQGKTRFLATASHDLRQPLQTLALLNGTLRRIVSEPDAVEAVEQQELAIGAMSRLLNALLDISKLESGTAEPERTDFSVASLFEELRTEFASLASQKGLDLQVKPSTARVYSDPRLVEQILRNLVSNAIKYTRQGYVLLQCVGTQAKSVRIDVLDTGIGIPADQLPHIYDEFFQVGVPANSSRDGYGLGLSIVKRLVKLLQLGFDVRSEVGKGSVFSVVLPGGSTGAGPEGAAAQAPPRKAASAGKGHILIVEDDLGVRDAMRMLLKVEGYEVSAVPSQDEALRFASHDNSIDLLVTDYHLGGGQTGARVIEMLRRLLARPVPAVLMTGDTSSAIREQSFDASVKVASKPLKAEELLSLVRALLSSEPDRQPP